MKTIHEEILAIEEAFSKRFGSIHKGKAMPSGTETEREIKAFYSTRFLSLIPKIATALTPEAELIPTEEEAKLTLKDDAFGTQLFKKFGYNACREEINRRKNLLLTNLQDKDE